MLVLRHPFSLLAILLAHSQSATAGEMWKLPSQSRNFFSNSWGYDSYPYFLVSSKEIWKDRGRGHLSVPEHVFHGDLCRFSHVPFCFTIHPLLQTNKDRFQIYMKKTTQLPKEQDLHLVNFHCFHHEFSLVIRGPFFKVLLWWSSTSPLWRWAQMGPSEMSPAWGWRAETFFGWFFKPLNLMEIEPSSAS